MKNISTSLKYIIIIILLFGSIACKYKKSENSSMKIEKPKIEDIEKPIVEKTYSTEINSLEDFQNSHFFERYNCENGDSSVWNNGQKNYRYDLELPQLSAIVELSILNDEFKHFGVTIFEQYYGLDENGDKFINDLLSEFNLGTQKEKTYLFIKENIEISLGQINQSKTLEINNLIFRAGKVIQQIITIDSI